MRVGRIDAHAVAREIQASALVRKSHMKFCGERLGASFKQLSSFA